MAEEKKTETTDEKAYELRDLQGRDVFAFSRIISKIGFKEFRTALESADVKAAITQDSENTEAVGLAVAMDIAGIIMEHLPDAEAEIYTFLASLSGKKREEVETMSMLDFVSMVTDVFKKPEFRDFTKVASKFAK